MTSIAKIVEEIVEEKPFVQEALSRGIINNAALANEITPEIERRLKKKAKFSAVNMAIRRLSENLGKTFVSRAKFDKDSDVTVKTDLIEIVLYKDEKIQNKLKEVYDIADYRKGDMLTITQGFHEIMIITNKKHEKKIDDLFPASSIKKRIKNLSSITINIPAESVETIGLFYVVTRALNWNNINIIDIVSTFTEMTFLVKEDDTSRALDVLKKLIESNR